MARHLNVASTLSRVNRDPTGVRAIGSGDAGGDAFARLNRDGEGRLVGRHVVRNHGLQAKFVAALGCQCEADKSTRMGRHKVDVVSRCELTYIDIIEKNDFFSSPVELKNVLPLVASQCNVHSDRREFVGINSTVTYRINENLLIEISTKLGKRVDTKEMVAMLEMKAHGTPTDISIEGARSWYQAAHDAIYETFLNITSKRVRQEVWKPL